MSIFENEKTIALPWNFYMQEADTYGLPVQLSIKHELTKGFNLLSPIGSRIYPRPKKARVEVAAYELIVEELQDKGIALQPNDIPALIRANYEIGDAGAQIRGNLYVLSAVESLPEIPEVTLCADREAGANPKVPLFQGWLMHIEP